MIVHHDPPWPKKTQTRLKQNWNSPGLVSYSLKWRNRVSKRGFLSFGWVIPSKHISILVQKRLDFSVEGFIFKSKVGVLFYGLTMGEKAGQFRIDTSGWSYPTSGEGSWNGVFYPPSKVDELQYYAQRFNNAEINMSFCRLLFKNMLKAGIARLRKGFLLP